MYIVEAEIKNNLPISRVLLSGGIYLLLTEVEGRAVNYGPRSSPSIYGTNEKSVGHISKGKNKGL